MAMRVGGMGDESDDGDLSKLVPTMEKQFKAIGVTMRGADGQVRPFYDLMKDLAEVFPTLDKNTQLYIGNLVAGKHNIAIFQDTMNNFDVAIKATETAMNSAGSAMRENEVYAKSLEGRMNNLKSSFSELANTVIRGEVVGAFIDMGAGILEIINKSGMAIPAVTGLGLAIATAFGVSTGGVGFAIMGVVTAISLLVKGFDELNTTLEEQNQKVSELSTKLTDLRTQHQTLANKQDRTQNDERQLEVIKRQIDSTQALYDIEKKRNDEMSSNDAIDKSRQAMEQATISLNKYQEALANPITQQYTNDDNATELLNNYQTLLAEQGKLQSAVDSLTGADRENVQAQIAKNEQILQSIDNTLGLTAVVESNTQATQEQTSAVSESEQQFNALSVATDQLVESADKTMESTADLTSAIDDLNAGNKLSGETIQELIAKHPELRAELVKTNTGYDLSIEAIERLRDTQLGQSKSALELQKSQTEDLINQTRSRISLYMGELSAIKTLSDAQTALAQAMAKPHVEEMATAEEMDDPFFVATAKEREDSIRDLGILTGAMSDMEKINNKLQDMDIKVTGSTGDYEKAQKSLAKSTKDTTKTIEDYTEKLRQLQLDLESYNKSLTNIEDTLRRLNEGDYTEVELINGDKLMTLDEANQAYQTQRDILDDLYAQYDALNSLTGDDLSDSITNLNNRISEETKKLSTLDKQLETIQKNEIERRKKVWEENKKAMIENFKEQMDLLKKYEDDLNDLTDTEVKVLKQELNDEKQYYEDKKDLAQEDYDNKVDKLEKYVKAQKESVQNELDDLEKAHDKESDLIDDRLEKYQQLIDARKKALSRESSDRTYNQQLSQMNKDLSDLETSARSVANDDTANAKYLELQQQIADKKLEIENLQYDHSTELQNNALDDELERYKNSLDDQKQASDDKYDEDKEKLQDQLDDWDDYLDDKKDKYKDELDDELAEYDRHIKNVEQQLSEEGSLRKKALDELENNTDATYAKLTEWNSKYGTGVTADIEKMWSSATSAVKRYGLEAMDVLKSIADLQSEISSLTSSSEQLNDTEWNDVSSGILGGDLSDTQKDVVEKMKNASSLWSSANAQGRLELESYNQGLGTSIGATYDDASGIWYLNGKRLYHSGGVVGGDNETKLKSNEEFAKLLKGEVVSTPSQIDDFMSKTLPSMIGATSNYTTNNGGMSIGNLLTINVTGNSSDDIMGKLQKYGDKITKDVLSELNKAMTQRGNTRTAKSMSI